MSAPSYLVSFKDGRETGRIYFNWGWVPPSHQEVGFKILKFIELGIQPGQLASGKLGEWDTIKEKYHGTLKREKYYEMYDVLKAIHYGLYNGEFNVKDYFE